MHGDELSSRVGELRRLTIMFCDVVGSTELSGRWEPETYRELMRGYHEACRDVIESRFEGHIVQLKGGACARAGGRRSESRARRARSRAPEHSRRGAQRSALR
jgi:class 3 adenylate cyclase